MTNQEIATLLRHVAAAFTITDEKKHHFQIVAYQKAADTIQNTSTQVADLVKEGRLLDLPGIGPTIQQHLEELVKTGKVKHFQTVMENVPAAMFPLLDIPSFGPKKAYKLVTHFRLKNPATVIQDIEKLANSGKIAGLESFGEKSQSDIIRAIEEFGKGAGKTTRMLLPFATEVADALVAYLKKCPDVVEVSALGSLRRKLATVGDVDIAVATKNPQAVIEYFVQYPYKERIIEKGPASSSLLTSGGHQVDLLTQPVEAWGSLLQHFTGSKHHNVHLRDLALRKGLSLSEYGIKKVGEEKRQTYTREEAFYAAIGLDFIPPELREDHGEIEAAAKHTLPKLVELSDIKGDLHIHSNYPIEPSHDLGQNTMQDMLTNAQKLGYEYLGFSEHNPSVSKHTKSQILSLLQKRAYFIEQLKESNKSIRVFNLLEVDILVNGDLAIDDKSLETLDGILVSIHSSFSTDIEKMTKRVLQGLSHPKAKILSHPTGRLINQRPGYQLDWEKIFAFCKDNNKALEINAWPERTDLPDTLIREAIAHGIKMTIDTDSHATSHMSLMQYGVWNARRGWAEKKDILNTLEYNEFNKWMNGGE
ncbi:MAG TPA: PHP domain-containing protein [Candidatus Eisenbacteria bacterium]|nr:PHP domain-containing protein [Candidatus Eisenbacteria bacterium]